MSDWDTGLFDCLTNCEICIVSFLCCPCQVAVQNATLSGRDCSGIDVLMSVACTFLCAVKVRERIREKYSIKGSLLVDIFLLFLCPPCAVSQQARQMEFKRDHPAGIFISGYHDVV